MLQIISENAPFRMLFWSMTFSLLCSETKRATRMNFRPSATKKRPLCLPGFRVAPSASVPRKPTFSPGLRHLPINGPALWSWLCACRVQSRGLPGGPAADDSGRRDVGVMWGRSTGPRTGLTAPAGHSLLELPLCFLHSRGSWPSSTPASSALCLCVQMSPSLEGGPALL